MFASSAAPRVVVGVDGSRAALKAAYWAVDEALDRELPLGLLCAVGSGSPGANAAAAAETAVRSAMAAIEALDRPPKLEAEIVHRRPVTALLQASRSAAVICLGSIGFHHEPGSRIGSTAAAVATSAHCPVAIVPRTCTAGTAQTGLVLAVVDGSSAGDGVLELGAAEAGLRGLPLRVFAVQQHRRALPGEPDVPSDPPLPTAVERWIARCRQEHPDLDVDSVGYHDGLLNCFERLQRNGSVIQLVVVAPRRPGPLDVLLAPTGRAVVESAGSTVLVCDRTWWL